MNETRILIVDDDSSIRRILARTFEKAGFSVETAANGEKAIACLSAAHFDIMISDIDMPRMTGKQLCRHLAADGPYLPAITVIVTGQMESNARVWVDEFESIRIIEKPVGPRQLLRKVKELLEAGQPVETRTE